jgi:hypothetical protein
MEQCTDSESNTIVQSQDERYRKIPDWTVNEKDLLDNHEISQRLYEKGTYSYVYTIGLKENSFFKAYQRPTLNFSLTCEENGRSRKSAYDVIMSQDSHGMRSGDSAGIAMGAIVFASFSLVCAIVAIGGVVQRSDGPATGAAFCMGGYACFNFILLAVLLARYARDEAFFRDKLTKMGDVETM